jgi:phosphatidyl-myo-inositol dimannoside synthase
VAKLYPKHLFLYLYLDGFLSTGGIQTFNRNFVVALQKIVDQGNKNIRAYSGYDSTESVLRFQQTWFRGFARKRFSFTLNSLFTAFNARHVVLGHINLSILVILIRLINPKVKITLIAHGIEVWGELSRVQRKALKNIDQVLAVSQFTQKILIEKHGVLPSRVKIFQNTLGYQFQKIPKHEALINLRKILKLPKNSLILLTVARLATYESDKGYDKIIELMPNLKLTFPSLHYVLAGSGSEQEISRLKQKIKDVEMEGHIHLPGFISNQELYTYFAGANVFVMPSKKEGFGIVYIEAMANGTPVIAGNKDGSTDAVSAYTMGHLVNPDDIDEIKETISIILSSEPNNLDSNKVIEDFSFDHFCKRVEALTQ